MNRIRLATGLAALCVLAPPMSAQELVTNGGFETGTLFGYTTTGCALSGVDNLEPHSGTFAFFDADVGTVCFLKQSITTVATHQYTFSFWLMNDAATGPTSFQALFGGQSLVTLTNPPAFSFAQQIYNVTATSSSTTLEFRFRNDPSFWDLDDVSVGDAGGGANVVAPEPSGVLLMSAGLLALGATVRRRRRRRRRAN